MGVRALARSVEPLPGERRCPPAVVAHAFQLALRRAGFVVLQISTALLAIDSFPHQLRLPTAVLPDTRLT